MKEILDIAIGKVTIHHPFFSSYILGVPRIEDTSVQTAATNGKEIFYNPSFLNCLYSKHGINAVVTLLVHEAAHIFLLHHTRRGDRDPFLWNIATDHVINLLIEDTIAATQSQSMARIPGWICDPMFKGMTAEQVYNHLIGGGVLPNGGLGIGDVLDAVNEDGTPLTDAQRQELETDIQARTRGMIQKIRDEGRALPAGVDEIVGMLYPPKNNWREVLARFVGGNSRSDFTWSRPSSRHLIQGMYLPALHSPDFLPIAFAIDTSGSVSSDEVNQAVSEVVDAVSCFKSDAQLPVIYCDSDVRGVETVTPGEHDFRPVGGGGTDYEPVMRYISDGKLETEVHALIYQTDGYCTSFGTDPGVPVLWILAGDHVEPSNFNPPFGEVIVLE